MNIFSEHETLVRSPPARLSWESDPYDAWSQGSGQSVKPQTSKSSSQLSQRENVRQETMGTAHRSVEYRTFK